MIFILALCLLSFQCDRKPLKSRKGEHQRTGLTKNARVCLHAEPPFYKGGYFNNASYGV